jgi:hypothetical protein
MNKGTAILFTVAVVLTISAPIIAASYGGGSGTEADPYQIWTAEQMNTIGLNPADWNKTFILKADIDLATYTGTQYKRIGIDPGNSFSGSFDGNGHVIRNLTYKTNTTTMFIGLFGYTSTGAIIKNLGLIDVNISAPGSHFGALIGQMNDDTTISSCYSTGSVIGNDTSIGGLVGAGHGSITSCYSTCTVNGTTNIGGLIGSGSGAMTSCYSTGQVSGLSTIGGLVGYNSAALISCYSSSVVNGNQNDIGGLCGENHGPITSCYSTGTVSGDSGVGGLIGQVTNGIIASCYSSSNVTGSNVSGSSTDIGGLVGHLNKEGTITFCSSSGYVFGNAQGMGGLVGMGYGTIVSCFSTGMISGSGSRVGGLVGHAFGTITSCFSTGSVSSSRYGASIGGLVGVSQAIITSCYSVGPVSGDEKVGGLVGDSQEGMITSCYSTGSVKGNQRIGGLVGSNGCSISFCYSTGSVSGVTDTGGLVGHNSISMPSCFWDINTSGQNLSAGGIGKTTAEMKDINTYLSAGWDFDSIWRMPKGSLNSGYPILSWQIWAMIVTPNGGESYNGGATQDIIWNAEGVGDLVLQYSVDNGSSWIDIVTVSNTGTYPWTIPNTLSNTCLVKISSVDDPSIFDISDAVFSIDIPHVYFADANLKAAVEAALGVTNPTAEDMLKLTYLNAKSKGITSLIGLETALNITTLYLHQNAISDITPLAGLNKLTVLNLYLNNIADISSLADLEKLYSLVLSSNKISDITPLAELVNLIYLYINNNQISDFSPITGQTKFKEIYATRNAVLTKETYLNHIPTIRANNPKLAVFQYDPGCKTLRSTDANQDCRVNLLDLAMIAAEWLTCNHIYEEMCP